MNASTQAVHNRLAAVLALAAARLDASRQQVIGKIAPEYFQRLDPHDLAARTPEDLLGALLSHLQPGEG
jgi:glutamate dehydrogenase